MVQLRGFLQSESGSMTQMALGFVLLTIIVGGVSVDVIRHERTRAQTQQALDACTANAAVVERPGTDATSMSAAIAACMARAGSPITNVAATSSANYKSVSANASGAQTSQFLQLVKINSLGIAAGSAVTVPAGGSGGGRAASTEVVLAYESSNATSGISADIQSGLRAFVGRTILDSSNDPTTITLMPYNNGVNLSTDLFAKYNVTALTSSEKVANSNCIDVTPANYNATSMSTGTNFRQVIFADLATSTDVSNAAWTTKYRGPNDGTPVGTPAVHDAKTTSAICPPYAGTVLRLPNNTAGDLSATTVGDSSLTSNINNGRFFGGVRWDWAMQWAVSMVDPGTNTAIASLMPTALNQLPLAYGTSNLQKVVVFINKNGTGDDPLTGNSSVLASSYLSGKSPIRRDSAGNYCIQHKGYTGAGGNEFWEPGRLTNPAIPTSARGVWSANCNSYGADFLTWPEVWKSLRVSWVAWQLYGRALGGNDRVAVGTQYSTALAAFKTTVPFADQVTRFLNKCSAAKSAGIMVYTVAVDALELGKPSLASCASSPSHYFDTTAAGFADTMRLIAQDIQQQAYQQ